MHDEVAWRVELVLNSGATDEFLALTEEMVATARNEYGVLSYQRFISGEWALCGSPYWTKTVTTVLRLGEMPHCRTLAGN